MWRLHYYSLFCLKMLHLLIKIYFLIINFFRRLQTSIDKFITLISYCCFDSDNSSNILEREKKNCKHWILSLPSSHCLENLGFYLFGSSSTFPVTSRHYISHRTQKSNLQLPKWRAVVAQSASWLEGPGLRLVPD